MARKNLCSVIIHPIRSNPSDNIVCSILLADLKKPELTCISEEGIADMDLPDNILDELEYLDNITSCNKVRAEALELAALILKGL
jgi:hypothetical protein